MSNKKEVRMEREKDRLITLQTQSGVRPKDVYGPEDVKGIDYDRDVGNPGEYPFTRGRHKGMYRYLLWVKHTAFGFQSAEKTNEWLKWQIERGMTSARITPDANNIGGVDPDHPLARDTIGHGSAPIYSLSCLDKQLEGISLLGGGIEFNTAISPWDDVCKYAMFVGLAQKRGVDWKVLRGAMVNDPLHTYACDICTWQPFELAWKLTIDSLEFSAKHTPNFHPIAPCGYDMRETGIDVFQELAFVLSERIEYIDAVMARGIPFEKIGRRIPLQFSGEIDFFETICKLRAARRMWAKIAKERYNAKDPKSMTAPCSINCAGDSMVAQQPIFNIIRLTIESMSSVLGGVQALELKGYDEPIALPSEDAEVINMGINNIVAHEANIPLVADPLGGSYYVEWLTDKLEAEATKLMKKIEELGGFIGAFKKGWTQEQVREAILRRQKEIDNKDVVKVCVNEFQNLAEEDIPIRIYEYEEQEGNISKILADCKRFKEERDIDKTRRTLENLHTGVKQDENLILPLMEAFKADATYGEVLGVIREAMGYKYDPFDMIERPAFLSQ